jgi:hypothetical protein
MKTYILTMIRCNSKEVDVISVHAIINASDEKTAEDRSARLIFLLNMRGANISSRWWFVRKATRCTIL